MKIEDIKLRVIPDSKGRDTLEAEMESGGIRVIASVPAGESTGKNEAKVIAPKAALDKISRLAAQIKERSFSELSQFDGLLNTLDGTLNKSNLGANLILSLSLCFTKLLAKQSGMETWQLISRISGQKPNLPLCFFNVIEGGVHIPHHSAQDFASSLPFQEYWFIPKTHSPRQALDKCLTLLKVLEKKIEAEYGIVQMGAEGGFTVPSKDPEAGLKILKDISFARPGLARLGIDVAASTFFKEGKYFIGDKMMNSDELLSYYQLLTTNYQLLSIEDPFDQEDWDGFSNLQSRIGGSVWIIGDDLLTTNVERIKKAHEKQAVNAVIIKPNQIGSVTETLQAANLAKSYGWKIIVANRGEETTDSFIADLAVGLGAQGLKSGCPLQRERLVKYERLVEIENSWHT